VGSVIPTKAAIIPAVGVDIGCGMIALRTEISARFRVPIRTSTR
jgi:tRNA-splicing ligase RtcB